MYENMSLDSCIKLLGQRYHGDPLCQRIVRAYDENATLPVPDENYEEIRSLKNEVERLHRILDDAVDEDILQKCFKTKHNILAEYVLKNKPSLLNWRTAHACIGSGNIGLIQFVINNSKPFQLNTDEFVCTFSWLAFSDDMDSAIRLINDWRPTHYLPDDILDRLIDKAIMHRKLDFVKDIVERFDYDINRSHEVSEIRGYATYTALNHAILKDDLDIVKYLVEKGANWDGSIEAIEEPHSMSVELCNYVIAHIPSVDELARSKAPQRRKELASALLSRYIDKATDNLYTFATKLLNKKSSPSLRRAITRFLEAKPKHACTGAWIRLTKDRTERKKTYWTLNDCHPSESESDDDAIFVGDIYEALDIRPFINPNIRIIPRRLCGSRHQESTFGDNYLSYSIDDYDLEHTLEKLETYLGGKYSKCNYNDFKK